MPKQTPVKAFIKGFSPPLVGGNIIGCPRCSGHQTHRPVRSDGKIAGMLNEGGKTGGKLNQRAGVEITGLAIVAHGFPEHGNVKIVYQRARLSGVVSPEHGKVRKAHIGSPSPGAEEQVPRPPRLESGFMPWVVLRLFAENPVHEVESHRKSAEELTLRSITRLGKPPAQGIDTPRAVIASEHEGDGIPYGSTNKAGEHTLLPDIRFPGLGTPPNRFPAKPPRDKPQVNLLRRSQ